MNIGIIGLGLIGGSIGRALIKKTDHIVYGFDISEDVMLKAGFFPAMHYPLTEDQFGILDVLIVALTPKAAIKVLEDVSPKLSANVIVADVAGNKAKILTKMRALAKEYPEIAYIGTHPMAGREYYGINHAIPGLFERASALVIPAGANIHLLALYKQLLMDIGFSDIVITKENIHDEIIAYTSQLPHLISSSYIKSPLAQRHDGFSAGSFRDLSRVARLNPGMWTELMLENSQNLTRELDFFIQKLNEYRDAIVLSDAERLHQLLLDGTNIKENIDKASREYKRKLQEVLI
ncbi:MAG: prephenate dehydrogenase/arogenate dehydrogenase family protein [Christensenellaceae bacterium]|nr:prephenate dehydrogenase/arogenate dehydrogenase family protein [Christensenellaceae bacterium]